MKKILSLLLGGIFLVAAGTVHAAWPERQITLVVPFPVGGGTDIVGRIIARELAQRLHVNVVVENRPGASGNIGSRQVSKASPDGYTLLVCTTAQTISGALYTQAGYDVVNDLEAISTINDSPLVLITRPGLKLSSVQELIELARRSPGKLAYATPGYGSAGHMAAETLSLAAGIRMLHIPYQGAAPMMADLVSGQVDIAFDLLITAKPYVHQGKVNRVGLATRERSPLIPDWQTLSEQSPDRLGHFNETSWNVLMAPKGTPAAILNALNTQMKNILSDEKVKSKFLELGSIPIWKTVGGTKTFVSDDARKWKKVVSDARIDKI
ncbi:MAG: tripartite tricarboxylate transporter substrate binding protein [Delftia acidovorans]|jgi:tripartite-type tricarboxylate transporter receptor subunit TctC|nr:tripartite tricarboxylate transporter substrate binding protein [Delftia acidovorans]